MLLAVLGFAAVTQVRTNTTDNSYAGYREQDLVDVLSALTGTSQRAQSEIDRLEATRRRLEADQQAQAAALAAARKQEDELAILAGSVPVTGPGIRVTVTEGPQHVDVDAVLDTIEELRSAGAEAMQVNGKVRLVAQSSVQATPAGLEIDGVELTSPYVFDVIGDPHTLRGALTLAGRADLGVRGLRRHRRRAGPEGPRHHRDPQARVVPVRPARLTPLRLYEGARPAGSLPGSTPSPRGGT